MTDPFAPPADSTTTTVTRPPRPRRTEPLAPVVPAYDPRDDRDVRERHDRDRDRDVRDHPEPAKPGLFWVVAAIGVGLLLVARLVFYFTVVDDLPDGLAAPALFAMLGIVTLALGLCLAAVLQRGLATPWRVALLLGAGFFAIAGDGLGLLPGTFL